MEAEQDDGKILLHFYAHAKDSKIVEEREQEVATVHKLKIRHRCSGDLSWRNMMFKNSQALLSTGYIASGACFNSLHGSPSWQPGAVLLGSCPNKTKNKKSCAVMAFLVSPLSSIYS
jgi:hypothetical protein